MLSIALAASSGLAEQPNTAAAKPSPAAHVKMKTIRPFNTAGHRISATAALGGVAKSTGNINGSAVHFKR